MSTGIISKRGHLELPASPHALPVAPYDVQVVIHDRCGEAPLISPEGKLRSWIPVATVLQAFQSEDVPRGLRFWVIPSSQVLLPEAAKAPVSSRPQADKFVPLVAVQTPELWVRFSKVSPLRTS